MSTTREHYVKVIVRADARRSVFEEVKPGVYEVSVRATARHGRANTCVCELAAAHFNVPVSRVRIVSGHQRPHKLLTILP